MAKKTKPLTLALDITETRSGIQSVRGELRGLEQTLTGLQTKLAACFGAGVVTGWLWQTLEKSGELSGSLSILRGAFEDLSGAVAKVLAPAVGTVMDLLSGAMTEAAKLLNYLGDILQVFFGVDKGVQNATKSQKKLTAASTASVKALRRSLASFDELNRLQKKQSGGSTGKTQSTIHTPAQKQPALPQLDFFQQGVLGVLQKITNDLGSFNWEPVKKYLDYLYERVKSYGPDVYNGLKFLWDEILMPIARWTVEDVAPRFLKLLNVALQSLATMIEVARPALTWLWNDILVPLGKWTGETVLKALEWLTEKLAAAANKCLDYKGAVYLLAIVAALLAANFGQCSDALGDFSLFGAKSAAQTDVLSMSVSALKLLITSLTAAVSALSAALLLAVTNWDKVEAAAGSAWQGVKNAWQGVSDWFHKKVLQPLESGFRSMGNGVIGVLNGILKGICSGINAAVRAINSLSVTLPRWIPGVGGQSLGFHLKTVTAPQIPYLARGAVLPANKPFMAVVGDQKHGTNVEAPLSVIQEAVAAVMQEYFAGTMAGHEATVAVLREILEAVLGISIGDDVIAAAVSRHNARMTVVKGGQV